MLNGSYRIVKKEHGFAVKLGGVPDEGNHALFLEELEDFIEEQLRQGEDVAELEEARDDLIWANTHAELQGAEPIIVVEP